MKVNDIKTTVYRKQLTTAKKSWIS